LKPKNRIGSSFAYNEKDQLIYMFAGYDESRELDDFWTFDIVNQRWELIQEHSEAENGPSRRCGQKMVYDATTSQIFMIGRKSTRTNETCKSDFYLFDTKSKTWFLICEDTSLENGPSLISDHEMCISVDQRMIYVFGGRSDDSSEYFSGLYSYHINTNTWNLIYLDTNHPLAANPEVQSVKSRVHHSMIYDHVSYKSFFL
jgi:N-acetylneuraminic acid mutarotase